MKGRNCQSAVIIYDESRFLGKLEKVSTSKTEKGAVFAVLKKKSASCAAFESCVGEQMVLVGTHVEKQLSKQKKQWMHMLTHLVCSNFPTIVRESERMCTKNELSLEEDTSKNDSDDDDFWGDNEIEDTTQEPVVNNEEYSCFVPDRILTRTSKAIRSR